MAGMPYPAAIARVASVLWYQFHLEFAAQQLPLKLSILAHIAGDHLLHLTTLQHQTDTKIIHSCIIGDAGQTLTPVRTSAAIQFSGIPLSPKPPASG